MTQYPFTMVERPTWEEVVFLTRKVCVTIGSMIPRTALQDYTLVGVTRGGLIPATIASHRLNLPMVAITGLKTSHEIVVEGKFIIIDDICDKGITFNNLKPSFPHALYCSIYGKPKGARRCDVIGKVVPQDTWVVFPWEEGTGERSE